jgi:hypothetical protein
MSQMQKEKGTTLQEADRSQERYLHIQVLVVLDCL